MKLDIKNGEKEDILKRPHFATLQFRDFATIENGSQLIFAIS